MVIFLTEITQFVINICISSFVNRWAIEIVNVSKRHIICIKLKHDIKYQVLTWANASHYQKLVFQNIFGNEIVNITDFSKCSQRVKHAQFPGKLVFYVKCIHCVFNISNVLLATLKKYISKYIITRVVVFIS